MEIIYTCPLGSQCEVIKDNKLHRCRWYVKLKGKDPQSDQEIEEFRCTEEWSVLLKVENSLFQRQTGAAVESLRNEVNKGNEDFQRLISMARAKQIGEHK